MTKKMTLPVPPRLSMDDYSRFVTENWENGNAALMLRQKAIEERIEKPFCIASGYPLSEQNGVMVHEGEAAV